MTRVLLALGANLGDRLANLRAAVRMLEAAGIEVTAKSDVWESLPVPEGQPPYLNAALVTETDSEPLELLAMVKLIEQQLGRRDGKRWGPRPIDIDILFHGDLVVTSETLTIPHPLIRERAFVLGPLGDVFEGPLPVLGVTAEALLRAVGMEGVRRTADRL